MRLNVLALIWTAASLVTSAPVTSLSAESNSTSTSSGITLDELQSQANANILAILDKRHEDLTSRGQPSPCNRNTVAIRKEYGKLTSVEKINYINAVKCLQQKSPRTPLSAAPGVRTRYDDFVATHINQTLRIHYTGNFLSWHRYYVWIYERSLREECGYTGYQPYWDWSKYVAAPQDNPMLDGSSTSLSGNGVFVPNRSDVILTSPGVASLYLKPGLGGGCIYNGPFANHTVNLGPVSSGTTGVDGGLGYNPRCLSRDINPYTAARFLTSSDVLFIMSQTDIYDFQMNLQGIPGIGIGAHGGGHYTVGNDMSDLFSSPNDPSFFVHHGQVDRVWTIWQWLDPVNRAYALAQTNTYLNSPPSANTTLNDTVQLGFAGGETKEIGQLMSVIEEDFCYIYV
ncbi:Di-copper centre-containing protein [Acephala macrosclerotiorum]|nr:Di-copper centre-containing protein [Acephala macrosclerotiorum]